MITIPSSDYTSVNDSLKEDKQYAGQFQITVFSRFCYVIMNMSIAWTIDKLKIT